MSCEINAKYDAHVVIAHYKENLNWIKKLRYPHTVISKHGIPPEVPPNRGLEASSYLCWINDNYDRLPEHTIFLHGHETAWHCRESMASVVNNLVFRLPYENLNDFGPGNMPPPTEEHAGKPVYLSSFERMSEIMGESIDASRVVFCCCSQFYVHRNSIRRHSKQVYSELIEWLMTTDIPSYFTGRAFEATWHLIFTGNHIDVKHQ